MSINNAFVINLASRPDRLVEIGKSFRDTSIGSKLARWNAIYGKDLSEETIKRVTSKSCNYICSVGMIGCWLSHYTLWQYIVQKGLDNVLILEDDAVPIENFDMKLDKLLLQIPPEYDLIYLGCFGSCDTIGNKALVINGKTIDDLFIPTMPLGLHGYMLSNRGAKKLTSYNELKKVRYHIDFALFYYVYNNDKDFNVYAATIPLIIQANNITKSDILADEHPIVNTILSQIPVSRNLNMAHIMNTQLFTVRHVDIRITGFTIFFACIALLLGKSGSVIAISRYIYIICALYAIELLFGRTPNVFEIFIHIIFIQIGWKFLRE